MARRVRGGACCASVFALLFQLGDAYKYHFSYVAGSDATTAQSALILSEGAMYPSHHGPFGTDGVSTIALDASITAEPPLSPGSFATNVNLWTAFLDDTNRGAVGHVREDSDGYLVYDYCCTPLLKGDGLCGPNVQIGGLIVYPDLAPNPISVNLTQIVSPSSGVPLVASHEVERLGRQYALLVACDASSSSRPLPTLTLDLSASFLNPYGYLPGQVYGLMPFYGVLFVIYIVLALALLAIGLIKRKYLILLQYCIFGVITLGIVEAATYLFMYRSKNESGIPTPCADCGNPTSDYLAAVSMSVIKRAVSRAVLLAVAMGFGVVHPSLSRRHTLGIVGLSLAYFAFGLINDLKRSTTYDVGPSMWELPVMLIDLLFLLGIYGGLNKLRRDLALAGQAAKLRMYTQLYRVLLANVGAWFVVTLANILVRFRALPVAWTALFLFNTFWDLLYLAIIIAVAVIWVPGERAFQYTYYSQSAASEVEADVEEGGELDGTGGGGGINRQVSSVSVEPGSGSAAGRGHGGIEMTATANPAAATTGGGQKGPATHAAGKGSRAGTGDSDAELDFGSDNEDIEITLAAGGATTAAGSGSKAGGARGHGAQAAAVAPAAHFAIGGEADDEEEAEGDRRKLRIQAGPAAVDARPVGDAPAAVAAAPPGGRKPLLAPPRAFSPPGPASGGAAPASAPSAPSAPAAGGGAAAGGKAARGDSIDLSKFD